MLGSCLKMPAVHLLVSDFFSLNSIVNFAWCALVSVTLNVGTRMLDSESTYLLLKPDFATLESSGGLAAL